MERQAIGAKLRFEVFKRDKFTCQYCGEKAPDVVLNVDHMHPVADGGQNDILNLITSCRGCNSGKGARRLDDASVLEKQREQIEELQERRAQLEMMLQWRDETRDLIGFEVKAVVDRIGARTGFVPTAGGEESLRRHIKRHGVAEVLAAVDEAFDLYLRWNGDVATSDSWSLAFGKIGPFLNVRSAAKNKEHLPKLLYIQGILRKRLDNRYLKCVSDLDAVLSRGAPIDMMEAWAKEAEDYDVFIDALYTYVEVRGR